MSSVVIPGLKDAVEREKFDRAAAFISVNETICGIEVVPLTIFHVTLLDLIESPFIGAGRFTDNESVINHVAAFMWLLNPQYSPKRWIRRFRFFRRLRNKNPKELILGIKKFVDESFQDSPGGSEKSSSRKSYYSFAAALVGLIAREYGWVEKEILNLPIKRALQYRNEIQANQSPKSAMFNPSDRLVGDWLNAGTEAQ